MLKFLKKDIFKVNRLLKQFPEMKDSIKEYYEVDPDFKKLCDDYENVNDIVDNLTTLANIPKKSIEKQIELEKELLNTLEKEIEYFLQNEK